MGKISSLPCLRDQGILCLLDAFESEDMDTKLEECMNARWEIELFSHARFLVKVEGCKDIQLPPQNGGFGRLGGGFKYFFFQPYLGKGSNVIDIFQMG